MGRPKKDVNKDIKLCDSLPKDEIFSPRKENKEELSKQERLKLVMREINKGMGFDAIRMAKDEPIKPKFPTGIKLIDDFIGQGFLGGNFSVVYGGKGVGKSTLMLQTIANNQKNGQVVAYLDLEHTFDSERAKKFGVDLDNLVMIGALENAEQAMDIVIKLSKEQVCQIIIIDSISAMSPNDEQVKGKAEEVKSMEDSEMALLARQMSKFLRRTASYVYAGQVSVILIGQVRTGGIGTFITKDTCSGGRAKDHWSVMTIYMRVGQGQDAPTKKVKGEDGKSKDVKIGHDTVLKIEKTKTNSQPEGTDLHIPFLFDEGFKNV